MDKSTQTKLATKNVTPLQTVLNKDVDRKEFLRLLGLGVLSVAGIGPLVHFLTGRGNETRIIYQNSKNLLADSSNGYGRSKYNQ